MDYQTHQKCGRTLATRKYIGFVLLAGAIGACVYLLSHVDSLGGRPILRYGLRAALVVCALVAWFWRPGGLIGSRARRTGAIGDGIHDLTPVDTLPVGGPPRAANTTLIISSLSLTRLASS